MNERADTSRGNDIKKKNNNSKEYGSIHNVNVKVLLLQPASFCATDAEKSTSQLVQETLHSVSGLSGIGATSTFQNNTNMNMQQGTAARTIVSGGSPIPPGTVDCPETDSPDEPNRKNPLGCCPGDDDDDDDDDAGAGIPFC
jgi:hypothetical protein